MSKRLSRKERQRIVEESMGIGKIPWDQFAPGIYNYCDRWCEKCDTSKRKKCFLFYEEEKGKDELREGEINPESTLDQVKKSFAKTKDLIEKIAEAEGVSLEITEEDEKEFEKFEKLTDPRKEPLYLTAKKVTNSASRWLSEVPSLDIDEYQEAHEELVWHHTMVLTKVYRALFSKKEAALEKGDFRKFSLEDSKNSTWVALRSAKICKNALEFMDRFVRDFRIKKMAEEYQKLIELIEENLLSG